MRFLSGSMLLVTIYVLFQSIFDPSDGLLLLTSNKMAVNLLLVVLAVGAVIVSFVNEISDLRLYLTLIGATLALLLVGFLGIVVYSYTYLGPLGPLDYLMIAQFGVIFSIGGLSVEHQPIIIKLPKIRLISINRIAANLKLIMFEPKLRPDTTTFKLSHR